MKRRIQQYFITGLLVWLPMGITVWILMWLVGMLDGIFLAVLGAADAVIPGMHLLADRLRNVPGLGVILVAVVVFSTGVFVANMFGQWWVRQWDMLMNRIPVVRSIYTSVKQVSDTLFSGSGNAFRKALLVQYPRQGSWTIAFLTGKPGGEVAAHLDGGFRQRLRADHAEPDLRFLPDDAARRRDRAEDERGRGPEVRDLHGRGGSGGTGSHAGEGKPPAATLIFLNPWPAGNLRRCQ